MNNRVRVLASGQTRGEVARQQARLNRALALSASRVRGTGTLCGASGGDGHGVLVLESESVVLARNVIRDSAGRGIALRGSLREALGISIEQNLVAASHGAGIALRDVRAQLGITIAGNTVLDTQPAAGIPDADGIQALSSADSGAEVEILANEVRASARIGVVLHRVGGSIDGNTIADSGSFGCVLQQSSAQLGTNTFSGNAAGDVQHYATEVIPFGSSSSSLPVPPP